MFLKSPRKDCKNNGIFFMLLPVLYCFVPSGVRGKLTLVRFVWPRWPYYRHVRYRYLLQSEYFFRFRSCIDTYIRSSTLLLSLLESFL